MIKIKFYSLIRMEIGLSEIDLEFSSGTIHKLFQEAEKKIDKQFLDQLIDEDLNTQRGTIILLNGRNIVHLKGMNTEVKAGDELHIFPPGGGG